MQLPFARFLVLALVLLLALASSAASAASYSFATSTAACTDAAFCLGRGVAANATSSSGSSSSGSSCSCTCTSPYTGYRCLFFAAGATVITPDCVSAPLASDQNACELSSPYCYWNGTIAACAQRTVRSDPVTASTLRSSPWCYEFFPIPFKMVVYAIATVAFGVSGIGAPYMWRYRDTYSIVEATGERVYNAYYKNYRFVAGYCVVLFVSAGALAISTWINMNDAWNCSYAVFLIIYIIVQVFAVIVWPLKWLVLYLRKEFARDDGAVVDLEPLVKPPTSLCFARPKSCQVRCF
jgi:hypothetical protein